jgi:hypothetical protein
MTPYSTGRRHADPIKARWTEEEAPSDDTIRSRVLQRGVRPRGGAGLLIFMLAPVRTTGPDTGGARRRSASDPAVIGVVLAGPFLLADDRGNHSLARQAIQSPPGPATVKQGCDGVGM